MRYEADRDNQFLIHYGVPGQKWGVVTKEYEPVAFDKRKQKHAQASVKQRANNTQNQQIYRTMYERGRSMGDRHYTAAARKRHAAYEAERIRQQELEEAQQQEEAEKQEQFMAQIKEQLREMTIDMLLNHSGETITIGKKIMGAILSKPISRARNKIAVKKAKIKSSISKGSNFIKNMVSKEKLKSIRSIVLNNKYFGMGKTFMSKIVTKGSGLVGNTKQFGSKMLSLVRRRHG